MVYTYDYDSDYPYGPALPVVEVYIRPVGRDADSIALRAIVDSGADGTVMPVGELERVGAERVGRARMRWGPHSGSAYDVYLIMLAIGPYRVRGVRVLADKKNGETILGRNVLNQLIVTLNGLAGVVEISDGE